MGLRERNGHRRFACLRSPPMASIMLTRSSEALLVGGITSREITRLSMRPSAVVPSRNAMPELSCGSARISRSVRFWHMDFETPTTSLSIQPISYLRLTAMVSETLGFRGIVRLVFLRSFRGMTRGGSAKRGSGLRITLTCHVCLVMQGDPVRRALFVTTDRGFRASMMTQFFWAIGRSGGYWFVNANGNQESTYHPKSF